MFPMPSVPLCYKQDQLELKNKCPVIMNKYPEAASVVQQGYEVLTVSVIENLPDAHRLMYGKALSGLAF
jgi:hypothetical protein